MALKSFARVAPALLLAALAGCNASEPPNKASDMIAQIEPPDGDYAEAPENQFGFMQAQESVALFDLFAAPAETSVARVATASLDEAPGPTNGPREPTGQQSQIAYSYGFGFRISSDTMAKLQEAHVALCEEMGEKCRVIRTSQARADSYDAYGELRMQIAADEAGDLAARLNAPAKELGGALISSVKDGEDLSEQIIDAEARLRSRLVLRGKLTEILRNQRGSVDELVKAEAAVAEVNEEVDATRSRLERYRNRIRFSDVRIEYEPSYGETQVGFVRPVIQAFKSVGSTLGMSLAAIIYAITALAPMAVLLVALRLILHRFGYRLRFWKTDLREARPEADTVSSA
ncbi:MAG: DUF4349 domain-containing protein [Erythrobacter sp.]|uniref:DUF4349 domain-containing protein n=1 Tax=Erythrobacter sp. TaxID=1042 RepID=UPI00262A5E73|nr:DUF4349 domain-containing protein [Erythrobacter sp.]MDJ0976954.1 DUF4349 domain-containing protein [Erythrobacter sp.]